MTNTATRTYQVAVIERALASYKVEAANPRDAAGSWGDGEFYARDDEALGSEGPAIVRERQPDGTWRKVPESAWKDEPPTPGDRAKRPYSVLLLYPEYANDGGAETYYAWVEAGDPIAAVAEARRRAYAANESEMMTPLDFTPLLVTEGHHRGQPMSNE